MMDLLQARPRVARSLGGKFMNFLHEHASFQEIVAIIAYKKTVYHNAKQIVKIKSIFGN